MLKFDHKWYSCCHAKGGKKKKKYFFKFFHCLFLVICVYFLTNTFRVQGTGFLLHPGRSSPAGVCCWLLSVHRPFRRKLCFFRIGSFWWRTWLFFDNSFFCFAQLVNYRLFFKDWNSYSDKKSITNGSISECSIGIKCRDLA